MGAADPRRRERLAHAVLRALGAQPGHRGRGAARALADPATGGSAGRGAGAAGALCRGLLRAGVCRVPGGALRGAAELGLERDRVDPGARLRAVRLPREGAGTLRGRAEPEPGPAVRVLHPDPLEPVVLRV